MMWEREAAGLDTWLDRAEASGQADVRGFAGSIRRDYAAVKAALTLPFSNGPVEGQVNRLKILQRQIYGRAKSELLRKRVLYAA